MRAKAFKGLLSLLVLPVITGVAGNFIFDQLKGHQGQAPKFAASNGAVVATDGGIAAGRDVHTGVSEEQIEQIITKVLRAAPPTAPERTTSRQTPDPTTSQEPRPVIAPKSPDAVSKPSEAKLAELPSMPHNNEIKLTGALNPDAFLGDHAVSGALNPLALMSSEIANGGSGHVNPIVVGSSDVSKLNFQTISSYASDLTKPLFAYSNLLQSSQLQSLTTQTGINGAISSIALASNDLTKPNLGGVSPLAGIGGDLTKPFSVVGNLLQSFQPQSLTTPTGINVGVSSIALADDLTKPFSVAGNLPQSFQPQSLTTQTGINVGASSIVLASNDVTKPNLGGVSPLAGIGGDLTKPFSVVGNLLQSFQPQSLTTPTGINVGVSSIALASYDVIKPNLGATSPLVNIGDDLTKPFSVAGNLPQSFQPQSLTTQTGINVGASSIALASYDVAKPNLAIGNALSVISSDPTRALSAASSVLQPSPTGILGPIFGTSNGVISLPASPLSVVRPQPL